MARYNGGKKQLGKELANVILNYVVRSGYSTETYFEPFCGMCGVMIHVIRSGVFSKYEACDLNPDIVCMWKAVCNGWQPPTSCTEEEWNYWKSTTTPTPERAFIGSACSFGGAYFSGFSGRYTTRDHYLSGSVKSIIQYQQDMRGKKVVWLDSQSYDAGVHNGKVIYCDPPYRKNKVPSKYFRFDSNKFWDVMRVWSMNNLVFISELQAPDDFVCIYEKTHRKNSTHVVRYQKEKLFIHNMYAYLIPSI